MQNVNFFLAFNLLLIYFFPLSAQEPTTIEQQESTFEYTKRVYVEVERLKDLNPDQFPRDVDKFRDQLEKYIFHKKRVCNGEFSNFILEGNLSILNNKEISNRPSKKLTPEEKKLCFKELKAFQVTYINNLFIARKRYLESLHIGRMKELDQSREEALSGIQKSFAWP